MKPKLQQRGEVLLLHPGFHRSEDVIQSLCGYLAGLPQNLDLGAVLYHPQLSQGFIDVVDRGYPRQDSADVGQGCEIAQRETRRFSTSSIPGKLRR